MTFIALTIDEMESKGFDILMKAKVKRTKIHTKSVAMYLKSIALLLNSKNYKLNRHGVVVIDDKIIEQLHISKLNEDKEYIVPLRVSPNSKSSKWESGVTFEKLSAHLDNMEDLTFIVYFTEYTMRNMLQTANIVEPEVKVALMDKLFKDYEDLKAPFEGRTGLYRKLHEMNPGLSAATVTHYVKIYEKFGGELIRKRVAESFDISSLSKEEIEKIRKLYEEGMTRPNIAVELCLPSPSAVRTVLRHDIKDTEGVKEKVTRISVNLALFNKMKKDLEEKDAIIKAKDEEINRLLNSFANDKESSVKAANWSAKVVDKLNDNFSEISNNKPSVKEEETNWFTKVINKIWKN